MSYWLQTEHHRPALEHKASKEVKSEWIQKAKGKKVPKGSCSQCSCHFESLLMVSLEAAWLCSFPFGLWQPSSQSNLIMQPLGK